MSIKKYPLKIIQLARIIADRKSHLYKKTETEGAMLAYVDIDTNSDFFFRIVGVRPSASGNDAIFDIHVRPTDSIDISTKMIATRDVKAYFDKWVDILEEYEKEQLATDPIIQEFQTEFFNEFIMDDDAEAKSFDRERQLWIENYLEKIEKSAEDARTEENSELIDDLQNEILILKEGQSRMSKRKVVEKVTTIWAKAKKIGKDLFKKVVDEAIKETVKQLISGNIDAVINQIG